MLHISRGSLGHVPLDSLANPTPLGLGGSVSVVGVGDGLGRAGVGSTVGEGVACGGVAHGDGSAGGGWEAGRPWASPCRVRSIRRGWLPLSRRRACPTLVFRSPVPAPGTPARGSPFAQGASSTTETLPLWRTLRESRTAPGRPVRVPPSRESGVPGVSAPWSPTSGFATPTSSSSCSRGRSTSRSSLRGTPKTGLAWLARKDSNLQSPDPESGALPLGHSPAMPGRAPLSLPRGAQPPQLGSPAKRGPAAVQASRSVAAIT